MTADPIRDALREAVRDMNGRMADRGYEVLWPEDGRLIAAAAVAAFFRALRYHLIATDTRGCPVASGNQWLAAAVERAAKEGA